MDIYMPVMDGFEATSLIKQLIENNIIDWPVKIIVVSAYTSKEEIEQAYMCGADAYFPKPIEF